MEHLTSDGKTVSDFNLPQPPAAGPNENRLLYQECHGYDMEKVAATLSRIPHGNDMEKATATFSHIPDMDQHSEFDTVTSSIEAYRAHLDACLLDAQAHYYRACFDPCCFALGDIVYLPVLLYRILII